MNYSVDMSVLVHLNASSEEGIVERVNVRSVDVRVNGMSMKFWKNKRTGTRNSSICITMISKETKADRVLKEVKSLLSANSVETTEHKELINKLQALLDITSETELEAEAAIVDLSSEEVAKIPNKIVSPHLNTMDLIIERVENQGESDEIIKQ
jgi:hypothetical protein